MTDFQALQLLKAAGIVGARPLENTPQLLLTVRRGATTIDVPMTEYRAGLQIRVRALEEEKKEILKNSYATRTTATFTVGGSAPLTMEALKSNDKLTKEERIDKTQRLMAVDAGMKKERSLLLALAHLQVHAQDLLPKLRPGPSLEPAEESLQLQNRKQLWTRGVKAAALYCLHQGQKQQADDGKLFLVCKEFIENFVIEDDADYSAERLFENVRQVRLLDSYE